MCHTFVLGTLLTVARLGVRHERAQAWAGYDTFRMNVLILIVSARVAKNHIGVALPAVSTTGGDLDAWLQANERTLSRPRRSSP
jgi:hypothetical protein